jgi:hypothetical protein
VVSPHYLEIYEVGVVSSCLKSWTATILFYASTYMIVTFGIDVVDRLSLAEIESRSTTRRKDGKQQ